MAELSRRRFIGGAAGAAAFAAMPFKTLLAAPSALPIEMYEVAGRTAFPLYGVSGGLCSTICVFPIIRRPDGVIVYRHDFGIADLMMRGTHEEVLARETEKAKDLFRSAIASKEPWLERLDGAEFPPPGKIAIFYPRKDVQYG